MHTADWIFINIKDKSVLHLYSCNCWCKENLTPFEDYSVRLGWYAFRNTEDATAFKLKFGL